MRRSRRPTLFLLLLALAACGDDGGTDGGTTRDSAPIDVGADAARDAEVDALREDTSADAPDGALPPPRDPFDGAGELEPVQSGFEFLEGPRWRDSEGVLLFTDIPANTIYRLAPPDAIDVFRMPSDNANGLANDADGLLLAAEHGTGRVSRTLAGGTVETVAERYMGDRLSSPNDIAVRSDGTLYFTDPPYGLSGRTQEVPFNGVYRVAPDGTLTAEWMGALDSRPNGIVLSPDQDLLYVADTSAGKVRVYDVSIDGSLSGERDFVTDTPGADGMAIDETGNLYVTTSDGVKVFSREAMTWGTIEVPQVPANCGFGDADHQTLYITARTTLYRVRIPIRGLP